MLCQEMLFSPPPWLQPSIAARTKFVDEEVVAAIAAGLRQVVILGAGYDDRALRFRTPGVRFFELDHPATQEDKARLLRAVSAGEGALTLAEIDFRTDDVGVVLDRAGHDAGQPTVFVCEGLLIYLNRDTCHRLLAGIAARAQPGSVLAASIAIHADGFDSDEVVAAANLRRRTGDAEPWRTILPAAEHLELVELAGWGITGVEESPVPVADVTHGRRSLLVTAAVVA